MLEKQEEKKKRKKCKKAFFYMEFLRIRCVAGANRLEPDELNGGLQ